MNAYDFDDTIYDGNSSFDLIFFTLRKKPLLMLKYIIKANIKLLKLIFKKSNFKELKETLYSFIIEIKDLDSFLDEFVEKYLKNIKPWYKEIQKKDDIVISASHTLWVKKFCDRIGIKNVIGTEVNLKTGKIVGKNCSGEEKLKRFDKEFQNKIINKAYSDSKKDLPLLKRAKEGYFVKGDKIIKFN